MDFSIDPHLADLRERTAAFINAEVLPHEHHLDEHGDVPPALLDGLRAKARAAGIFAPHVGSEFGGLGLDVRGQSVVFEQAGKSLLGPRALNISAPDEGNMHLLEVVATPAQKERYLRPLAAGTIRSCFAMTEPAPGAGSDPSMLVTAARERGGRWSITGEKWYITGADGAAFAICMARTEAGATMFLVDAGTPGYTVRKRVGSIDSAFPGGHCEVSFSECEVGADAVLGAVGEGFKYAQVRLAPARLTHCMRWLGIAVRSLDIAIAYARERESFGKKLTDHQMVQAMIADSATDIHLSRLAIWHTAWVLDRGQDGRHESSLAKMFVAEAVHRVVDRAMQICGARGMSEYLPLARFYREVRPFRVYDGASEVHRSAIARRIIRNAG